MTAEVTIDICENSQTVRNSMLSGMDIDSANPISRSRGGYGHYPRLQENKASFKVFLSSVGKANTKWGLAADQFPLFDSIYLSGQFPSS